MNKPLAVTAVIIELGIGIPLMYFGYVWYSLAVLGIVFLIAIAAQAFGDD